MLNILISGCGYSFSKQERKTWVNVLQSSGIKVTDVGGPAVSNQYILNKTIVELQNNKYDFVLIQLTSIGKLDVTVNQERIAELVETDSLRNFTWNGIWPSSHSDDHVSKKLYNHWLVSPELEVEDIFCKLLLLNKLYKNIFVLQAYDIPWRHSDDEIKSMFDLLSFITTISIQADLIIMELKQAASMGHCEKSYI